MNEKMILAKKRWSKVGLLVGVGMALAARGEQVATLDTVGNVETLYTASYWSNNISPTNELAAGWVYQADRAGIRLPDSKTLSFKCQKMIFGTSDTRCDFYGKTCTITFENEGLHLVQTMSRHGRRD